MRRLAALSIAALAAGAATVAAPVAAQETAPVCAPGGAPITARVEVDPEDAKTYDLHPIEVAAGTTRVEVDYDWGDASVLGGTDVTKTTVDLGIWDADGYRSAEGFRGWSGSRDKQVFVAQDEADRTYLAGAIEPGTWWIELGVAAVAPDGGWYSYRVRCLAPAVGQPPPWDPVDPAHVADPDPGWYHGDFHMHGYHSNPQAPTYDEFVAFAREQGLDFFPLTEYVVPVHWGQLGPYQRANPDVLFWPGREIITYFGHATQFGETPDAIEYRHGFEDVTMDGIVAAALDGGAMLGVAHPTTFDGTAFENFCRGCGWDLEDVVAWSRFTTIEVVTGPVVVRPNAGSPGFENPFVGQAVQLWEDLLNRGVRLTAVGGSDDKVSGRGSGYAYSPHGVPATAVYARELSRAALRAAVEDGHAYVRTRGVADSPAVEVTAGAPDGATGRMGDTLVADTAELTVEITGGQGQALRVIRNGDVVDLRPITGETFTHTFTATRDRDGEGPLGTWWRFETFDEQSRTTITNPVFLADQLPPDRPAPPPADPADPRDPGRQPQSPPQSEQPPLPATGAGLATLALALALVASGVRRPRVTPTRRSRRG